MHSYAHVAVFKAQDPKKSFYTYFIDKAVPVGTLVRVQFGGQSSLGIVMEVTDSTPLPRILPILAVYQPVPFLNHQQLRLITWLATYYKASLSTIMPLVLPPFVEGHLRELAKTPKTGKKRPQTLILVPNHHKLGLIAHQLTRSGKTFVIYEGEQPVKERCAQYASIMRAAPPIILATRIGTFLPFAALSQIYLYDEHNWSYKELHTPAFHTMTVAQELASIWHAPLTVIDQTPRIQTWQAIQTQAGSAAPVTLRQPKLTTHRHIVIDMSYEAKKGNDTVVSETLLQVVLKAVLTNRTVLLYLNKKQDGGMAKCSQCHYFGYHTEPISLCPVCKQPTIRFTTVNVRSIALAINRALKTMHNRTGLWRSELAGSIVTFTPHNDDTKNAHPHTKTVSGQPLITIATTKIFYTPTPNRYSIVGVVMADTLWQAPEFRATEQAYATLMALISLAKPQAPIIIQTKQVGHPLLRFIADNNYEGFAYSELTERQPLHYPPFYELLLLSFKAKTTQTAQKHAATLVNRLQELHLPGIEVSSSFGSLHKNTETRILLKAKTHQILLDAIDLVPSQWRIDFDPENIVT